MVDARWMAVTVVLALASAAWAAEGLSLNLGEARFSGGRPGSGQGVVVEPMDEGVRLTLNMGADRVNWNNARWSVFEFPQRDLSAFNAVALRVKTEQPRSDAGVYVALREHDGSWYYVGWASELTRPVNEGLARFEDMRVTEWSSPPGGHHHDANNLFDADRITAIAIGSINPFGVGEVSFTVTDIEFVNLPREDAGPARLAVSGEWLDVNGTAHVPHGLFGTFAMREAGNLASYRMGMNRHLLRRPNPADLTDELNIMVYCYGERTQTAPRIHQANWRERLAADARSWAAAGRDLGHPLYVEFWNEPYLNWANRNRLNFNPQHYNVSEATEGGEVRFSSDGSVAEHLRWTQDYDAPPWNWLNRQDWRRGRDERGNVHSAPHAPPYNNRGWQPNMHPPLDVADGETYEVGGRTLTAFTPWHIYDQTQFTYWSGRGMGRIYDDMMMAFGPALKDENPDATFIVGWGMRPSEDTWASWEMLYRPTIDRGIAFIDGVHDHDYGGDPLKMAANYEVVTAYGVVQHNKWLTNWNTEQGAQPDPQAYGEEAGELNRQGFADFAKHQWSARKLISTLALVPDKARSFAHFGHWFAEHGQGVTLTMLRNFRGRLINAASSDPMVYIVAAVDGTDPRAPRPADMPDRKELVVAILNEHVTQRQVQVELAAPAGTSFAGELIVARMEPREGRPSMVTASQALQDDGNRRTRYSVEMRPREMIVLTLPLAGEPAAETPQVRRRQFFADSILRNVTPQEPVTATIAVDADALQGARRAWVRFVAEKLDHGEGILEINGRQIPMPAAVTPENTPWLREIPISPEWVRESNELTVRTSDPQRAGFLLGNLSLIVEAR